MVENIDEDINLNNKYLSIIFDETTMLEFRKEDNVMIYYDTTYWNEYAQIEIDNSINYNIRVTLKYNRGRAWLYYSKYDFEPIPIEVEMHHSTSEEDGTIMQAITTEKMKELVEGSEEIYCINYENI